MQTISLIVPVYNEKDNIAPLYQRIQTVFTSLPYTFELIYVDNRSTDACDQIIRDIANQDSRVKLVRLSRNTGYYALSYFIGIEHAVGDALIFLDGDIQDPPEVIPMFLQQWEQGAQVVYGVRTKRHEGFFMRMCLQLFNHIFSYLTGGLVPSSTGDFSLVDRKVADIMASWKEKSVFFRATRSWVGFRSVGVPYERQQRYAGRVKNNWSKKWEYAKLAITSYSLKPLSIASNLLVFTLFLGFPLWVGGGIWLSVEEDWTEVRIMLWLLSLLALFLTASMVLVLEYLSKVHVNTTPRALFVVDEVYTKDTRHERRTTQPEDI